MVLIFENQGNFVTPIVNEALPQKSFGWTLLKAAFEENWYFVWLHYFIILGVENHVNALKVDMDTVIFWFFIRL